MPKKIEPQLYSIPVLTKIEVPNRTEMLAKIESGEIDHIDFPACVYVFGPNTNSLTFNESDMPDFAKSFVGQPFLRNHETWDIESRDGTIIESAMNAKNMEQTIRLTTRRGMTSYIEGQIDRFSIGWYKDDVICTICNSSWYGPCPHWPGREYETSSGKKTCQLLSVNPKGKETSAVNAPAVKDGTGLLTELEEYKLSIQGDNPMQFRTHPMYDRDDRPAAPPPAAPAATTPELETLTAQLREKLTEMNIIKDDAEKTKALSALTATGNQLLVDQCSLILTAALNTSRLPEVVQEELREQYAGQVFKLSDLQAVIEKKRKLVSTLTAGQDINAPGRNQVTGMFNSEQEIRAALDDLLGAPREADMVGKKVRRLSGIREAYVMLTGDVNFYGGSDPQYALGTTATFPGIVKDSMNKILTVSWSKYGLGAYGWWQQVVTVEHFDNLNEIDWLQLGTIGSLPVIEEQGNYTELPIGDNVETSAWYKYGGYIGLTLEAILRDDARAFRKLPDEVAKGAMRNISEQFAAVFTTNSNAGPVMADDGALFNATAVTTAGGHANLLTTALGTDYTAWNAVSLAMFKQPMPVKNATGYYGVGKKQGIRPKFSLHSADRIDAASTLFLSRQNPIATYNTENRYYGQVFPLCVPEWTDDDNFAAVADPNELPTLMLGEIFGVAPQIFVAGRESDPAMFANDESRIKVRQFLAPGVADWRGLHKSNV